MHTVNSYIKQDRKKRFSETRGNPLDLKCSSQTRKAGSNHNRSSSTSKDPKIRLHTDYDHYDGTSKTNAAQNLKQGKKVYLSVYRNHTQNVDGDYVAPNFVQSTKSNVKKNIDLRLLFKSSLASNQKDKPYDCKIKAKKNKIMGTHGHPFLKFLCKKPQLESPYSKGITKIQQAQRLLSRSMSKGKRNSSKQARQEITVNKEEIQLKTNPYRKEAKREISRDWQKDAQEDKFELKKKENVRGQIHRKQSQEQSTVKTIKKQADAQPQFELSQSSDSEGFGLTEQEQETFGDRFPYGFEKMKLLGRGGFSLVWLGKHNKSGKQFAIKQIITQNTHQTHIKQIWFGTMFFTLGGVAKPQFAKFAGIKNLVRLYSYEINQTDTWIFYQKCGSSLGSSLYDIRSEKVYGEHKLYKIHYKPIYQAMAKNPAILPKLTIQICKSLSLLAQCEIVHSDLKTENILIRADQAYNLTEVKLIDYGSSFEFKNISQFSMATPEYMPPEILNYIIHENEGVYEEDLYNAVMSNYKHPWTVDMWSLGCVLLEIIVGVPLWMSLPLLVPSKTGNSFLQKEGLFAVKGRLFPEIIQKQRKIVGVLDDILEKDNYSRIVPSPTLRKIIKAMLEIDFNKRISPDEVIRLLETERA